MASSENIRSFALLGKSGSGKTALAEAILMRAGVLHQIDGGHALDTEPEEVKRESTVVSKIQVLEWDKCRLVFADTPGAPDFVGSAICAMHAMDAVVIVIDATSGVDVPTRLMFEQALALHKPVLFFLNKLDKDRADFDSALESIRASLSKHAHPVTLPIWDDGKLVGVMDLIDSRAFLYDDGEPKAIAIPASERERFDAAQRHLIEEVAETDEALFDKLTEGQELKKEDILPRLMQDIEDGEIIPVLVGSANPPRGTTLLLDTLAHLILPPTALPPAKAIQEDGTELEVKLDPDEPAIAQVFKVYGDAGVGDIFFLKVVTGTLRPGMDALNVRTRERERIGHLFQFRGKERVEIGEAAPGDVVAVAKLKSVQVGDTLCDSSRQVRLPEMKFPEPVHSVSVTPKTRKDQDKLGIALAKLALIDPTLHYHIDPEFNETILAGMGETHLEVVAGRLQDRYGVGIELGRPHVPYRQALTKKAEAHGRHKKQTGGHGQFGDVWIRIEPLPRGAGFEFVDEIKGGVVPGKFIPSVETGLRQALKRGSLGGFPVVDVKATLFDGSYHSVDSSDVAFQQAAMLAFRQCEPKTEPILLEPIMKVRVTVPADYLGAVSNNLSAHRGKIEGIEGEGDLQTVVAEVPQAEMFSYSTELRSLSHGAGSHTTTFSHYEPVPPQLLPQLLEQLESERQTKN